MTAAREFTTGYYVHNRGGLTVTIEPRNATPGLRSAACNGHPTEPPESWTTDGRTTADMQARDRARQICRSECRSRRACLEFATRTRQTGIWGGMDADERSEVR